LDLYLEPLQRQHNLGCVTWGCPCRSCSTGYLSTTTIIPEEPMHAITEGHSFKINFSTTFIAGIVNKLMEETAIKRFLFSFYYPFSSVPELFSLSVLQGTNSVL